jgi:hypothetical protein
VDGLDLRGSRMPATVPCAREAGRERTGCQGQRGMGVGRLEGEGEGLGGELGLYCGAFASWVSIGPNV